MTKLNSLNINKLPEGTYLLEKGIFLRVQGRYRYWIFRYQLNKRRREISLGSTQGISIATVKKIVAGYRNLIAQNIDPLDHKQQEKSETQFKNICPTIKEFSEEALEHIVFMRQFIGTHTVTNWRTTLKQVGEHFKAKKIDEITSQNIVEYLKQFWETHPRKAQDSLGRLYAIFDYAILKGWIKENPAQWKGNLDKYLPSIKLIRKNIPEKHYHALSFEKLKEVVKILRESTNPLHKAILFGILTTGRCCEWRLLQWSEVDEKLQTVTLTPDRRKDKKPEPYVIPLSKQAFEILQEFKKEAWSTFIFVSEKTGRPYGRETPLMCFKRLSGVDTTYHGIRSTFSDWCAKNEKSFIVVEKCLMHSVGNSVFRAYQRDDLLNQRRKLLQEWADALYQD